MAKLFFSYSHRDEALREELEIHLSGLKRQGVIETWHDRRIGAGKEFGSAISEHLEEADIILLLVSPYLIASDYCYDIEVTRALERHEAGEAIVIPVILHPCDWKDLPFGKLLATPKDGKPVSKFPNQHDGFLDIVQAIRKAAEEINEKVAPAEKRGVPGKVRTSGQPKAMPEIRSSNLRVKKRFTDRDKDKFLSDAFEYMANFFEGSLAELEARNPEVETDFRRIDKNHFTATVYIAGSERSRCKIWFGGRNSFPSGIAYSYGSSSVNDNSFNESLSAEDDGYTLYLKALGMPMQQQLRQNDKMSFEGAAEYFWGMFIQPLQR
jgi:hypothetical protein